MPLGNAQQPVLSGSEQQHINNICCQIEHNIISTTCVVRLCSTIGQMKVSLGKAQHADQLYSSFGNIKGVQGSIFPFFTTC